MRSWVTGLFVAALVSVPTVVAAQTTSQSRPASESVYINVCVSCAAPEARYACELFPPEEGTMDQSAELFCAGELARQFGHQSCFVVRGGERPCIGAKITMAYTGPVTPFPSGIAGEGSPDAVSGTAPTTVTDGNSAEGKAAPATPPKTLVEATDRAVQSTGEQLQKAGETVGDATRKTGTAIKKTGETIGETVGDAAETVGDAAKSSWQCVTSFFQDC